MCYSKTAIFNLFHLMAHINWLLNFCGTPKNILYLSPTWQKIGIIRCIHTVFVNHSQWFCVGYCHVFKKIFFKDFLLIFRERGREGEREGEKHQCVVSICVSLTGNLASSPGTCPDWESNQRHFTVRPSIHSDTPARAVVMFFYLTV